MAGRPAPSLPTPKQIADAHEAVAALYPAVRIIRVGPDGVTFDYPDMTTTNTGPDPWVGKPFSDRG